MKKLAFILIVALWFLLAGIYQASEISVWSRTLHFNKMESIDNE